MVPVMKLRVIATALLLTTGVLARPAARDAGCEIEGVPRVVAVGDVHGAYDNYVTILRAANLINDEAQWIGAKAHLVQVGDVVDRGPDSRRVIDLLRRLQPQAAAAGGAVHYLLGNHEVLRMANVPTYTSPGEYAVFATASSPALREQMAESVPPAARADVMAMPLGEIELVQAFGPKGEYGAYLRSQDAMVRINGVVFVHGGIAPKYASLSCADVNKQVRRELDRLTNDSQATYSPDPDDPLWYRGYANEPDTFQPEIDKILDKQHARAIVVGHTPTAISRINARFERKIFLIDTGIQNGYVPTGRPSALEIVGDRFVAIYRDAKVEMTLNGPVVIAPEGAPAPAAADAPKAATSPDAQRSASTPGPSE